MDVPGILVMKLGPNRGGASVMDVPGILASKEGDMSVGGILSGFGDKSDVVGIIAGIRVVVVNDPVIVWSPVVVNGLVVVGSPVVWSPVVVCSPVVVGSPVVWSPGLGAANIPLPVITRIRLPP